MQVLVWHSIFGSPDAKKIRIHGMCVCLPFVLDIQVDLGTGLIHWRSSREKIERWAGHWLHGRVVYQKP